MLAQLIIEQCGFDISKKEFTFVLFFDRKSDFTKFIPHKLDYLPISSVYPSWILASHADMHVPTKYVSLCGFNFATKIATV